MNDNNVTEVNFSGPDTSVHGMLKESLEVFRSDECDNIVLIGKDMEGAPIIGFNHDLNKEEDRQALVYTLTRASRSIQELLDTVEPM